jgi:hypothetical protein
VQLYGEVKSVQHAKGRLIMQGGKDGRGWGPVILEDTGKMSAVVADGALVIFGACTAPYGQATHTNLRDDRRKDEPWMSQQM